MALPTSRNQTYIPGVTSVASDDLNDIQDWIVAIYKAGVGGMFGDGSDGTVTLDGTVAAPSWASKSGSVYTMNRDVFCENLTIDLAQLATNGFRLYVRDTLTTQAGGTITANGLNGSGGTAGAASPTGTVFGGAAGGNGATGGNGANGTSVTDSLGGSGGAGGAAAPNTAGTAGTATQLTAAKGSPRAFSAPSVGHVIGLGVLTGIRGGGGGSGGAGAGTGTGGGGASAGGVLCVVARQIDLESAGDLHARGGNGANGTIGDTGGGGGGGGGGGVLIVVYSTKNAVTFSAANNATGGGGGSGAGTGASGNNGSHGTVIEIETAAS